MPKTLPCPRCGVPAIDRGVPLDDELDEPFCAVCKGPLTREGLLVETEGHSSKTLVKEIGKGGRLIWEYTLEREEYHPTRGDAMRLLATLAELEDRARSEGKVADIREGRETAWNRKAAARRFRRWFDQEWEKRPLQIDDPHRRELADQVLKDSDNREPDYGQMHRDMIEERKYLDKIRDYEESKLQEAPLLLNELPSQTHAILEEVQEAYRVGTASCVNRPSP